MINLSDDIKELLMAHGSVVVPGFGAFTSTYKPAVADGVMGQVSPPSVHLAFDPNLQVNDGKLVEHIRERHRISATAAQEAIAMFTLAASAQFEQSEVVVLPEIGRLYRDFSGKIQFLPDGTNFNAESFGLPTVQFYPVSRTKFPVETPPKVEPILKKSLEKTETYPSVSFQNPTILPTEKAAEPLPETLEAFAPPTISIEKTPLLEVAEPPTVTFKKPKNRLPFDLPSDWRRWLPAFAAAAVVVILAIIYVLSDSDKGQKKAISSLSNDVLSGTKEGSKKALPAETAHVNVSPRENPMPTINSKPPAAPTQPPVNQRDTPFVSSDKFLDDRKKEPTAAVPLPEVRKPTPTNTKTYFIGAFGQKSNVKKNKDWIEAQGYNHLERKVGGLTRLYCEFGYETNTELQQILKKLRVRFGNDIVPYGK